MPLKFQKPHGAFCSAREKKRGGGKEEEVSKVKNSEIIIFPSIEMNGMTSVSSRFTIPIMFENIMFENNPATTKTQFITKKPIL